MKVLIVGSGGQLGYELKCSVPYGFSLICASHEELSITNETKILDYISMCQPNVVINAAAYTAVDRAEQESTQAYTVNVNGAKFLATACAKNSIPLVHISTDFIFDGKKSSPYSPDDTPKPLSVYGKTKLAGERQVRALLPDSSTIIRTSWVYSTHGNNFVKSMLRLMKEKKQLAIVSDQVGSPTWASNLAICCWSSVDKLLKKTIKKPVYHYSDAGIASWYDFAVAIQEDAYDIGLLAKMIPIFPIQSNEYPTAAQRPLYSVLDKTITWSELNAPKEHWRVALRKMLVELKIKS